MFSTRQVVDSPEHKLLMSLRETELKDPAVRQAFYDKVIESLDMDGSNYLVLLAHDAYDVPFKAKDGLTFDQVSDTMFHYVVCCVCPVKEGKAALGFYAAQNEFHSYGTNQVVGQPELGFLFPAFDDRAANIYNALFYTRKPDQLHQEFIDGVFHIEPPMSAAEQRETFETILSESLGEACTLQLAQNLHEWARGQGGGTQRGPGGRPPGYDRRRHWRCFAGQPGAGCPGTGLAARFAESFGASAALNPANLISTGKFELGDRGRRGQSLARPLTGQPHRDHRDRRPQVPAGPGGWLERQRFAGAGVKNRNWNSV